MKLLKSFKIRDKIISDKSPSYIIAEVGVNHGGSVSKCARLIKEAHKSGADAVKLQIANPFHSYSENHPSFGEFKNKFLSNESLEKLIKYSNKLGLAMFATPGDLYSLDRVAKLKMPAIKISSGLLTNLPLIKEASKKKVPLIISTGMSYLKEIKDAINICKKHQNKIAILKCTSIYPAPIQTLNLSSIGELKKIFKIPIGYSDHAMGINAATFSIGLGATILEKHFTLDKSLKGADHKISIEPKEFKKMVENIRDLEVMSGSKSLKPTKDEMKNRKFAYRKLVSLLNIDSGEKISLNNVGFKRIISKQKGILPKFFFKIEKKRARRNIRRNEILSLKDFK